MIYVGGEEIRQRHFDVSGRAGDIRTRPAASRADVGAAGLRYVSGELWEYPKTQELRNRMRRVRQPRLFKQRRRVMRRRVSPPRSHWQEKVTAAGLTWHTAEQHPYWNESAFYEFTAKEIDLIESATNGLEEMTLHAAEHMIDNHLYSKIGIPDSAVPLIEHSWDAEPPSLYGRFDLAYRGDHLPKLLEYNADTPTSLLEAAVVQWYWLEETHPEGDQFNSIHERLIGLWKELAPHFPGGRVDFCSLHNAEDWTTAMYLQDTAQQAGLRHLFLRSTKLAGMARGSWGWTIGR